ncbi:cysteine-rich receptor-like protein kinase 27 [Herrania umbratica]|uniref:Cysteine-rich receptor-like protein kinase 27 n=1 Tax=Herrania umbratica TaxID=108875 RepID=A0A6J0ZRN3_9ROSI|nr:cysteine-rich receptor-like protein kinase 27 [Herrania umbratica]
MGSQTIFILLFIFLSSQLWHFSEEQTWVKAGYWYANGEFPIQDIDSALFNHLSCAFAEVNPSTYQLFIPSASEQYFSNFTSIVKRKNPSVKALLSVWNGISATGKSITGEKVNDSVLSSMISESSKRKSFVDSSIKTARRYGFHGIDLFWLWPSSTDLANIGVLLDEWRAAINSEPRKPSESQLILTIAVRYLPEIEMVSYPIESISRNVDWAHVVAYDYHLPSRENFTGVHAALYNPSSHVNTDFGIREWLNKGFPPSKLVLGLPYHGWAWKLVSPQDNAIGAHASGPAITIDGSMGYKSIKSYIRDYGYGAASVYNATYVVNLFTSPTIWINFDGVETVKAKIAYAKEKRLTGYNAFQLSNDDNWALSRAAQEGELQENKQRLLLKIILPVSLVVVLAAAILYYLRRRKVKSEEEMVLRGIPGPRITTSAAENFASDVPHLQVFRFANIKAATNNFSTANKLGEGGFGPVYKGKLPRGQEIAVKRLSASSSQGLEEFQNEVTLTARLQHVNLVRVLGYCTEKEEKMLIYECMPNKSLDLYLFDPIRRSTLDWEKRVHIIEGVTQGLLYLQEYANITVIHRDIKASNILLDDEMNPKISDFGMARLFRKDAYEANTSRIVGTYGYLPPEYLTKGTYSIKYDVYSFGVLLLQIISGKRNTCYYGYHENLNLLEFAYDLWNDNRGTEFIDPSLDDSSSPCKIMRCMQIALLCVQENPGDRPSMLEVFTMLKNDSMATTSPRRPAFSVKADKSTGSTSTSQQGIYSFNDPQISELEPR